MIKDDFNSFLKAASGVTAIVSSRIYPKMIPQNTSLPAIVHSVTGEADVKDMAGEVMYMTTSFAIECWDSGYRNAAVLSAAVKAAMKAATSYWWGADLVGETDSYDPETNEDNVTLNYLITHQGD